MFDRPEGTPNSLEALSALADGEVDASATVGACGHWRDALGARSAWHAYHLIGDVMRSEELASGAGRDAAFLQRLRERLAQEPVVLAPQAEITATARAASARIARGGRWSWMAPTAVAAAFMAVASALVVTRGTAPVQGTANGGMLSSLSSPAVVASVQAGPASASFVAGDALAEPQTLLASDPVVRDARLDRYLTAHKQFDGSSALGAPSGFLRASTTQMSPR